MRFLLYLMPLGMVLAAVLLLFEPVIDAAQSLILNETVEVQGKKVGMQMFTLQCPLFLHKEGNWASTDETYTFHLIDKRALPTGVEPRLQANGYYSFRENKWNRFQSIEENRITLGIETPDRVGQNIITQYGKEDIIIPFRDHGGCEGSVRHHIDRNTLEVVFENVDKLTLYYEQTVDPKFGKWRKVWCDTRFPKEIKELRKTCKLLPYKAPPERIGF